MKTIEFYRKNVYGNDSMYVADPEVAHTISTLTGRKTISANDMKALEKLGFEFVEVLPTR